jgi:hypothetical protein
MSSNFSSRYLTHEECIYLLKEVLSKVNNLKLHRKHVSVYDLVHHTIEAIYNLPLEEVEQ